MVRLALRQNLRAIVRWSRVVPAAVLWLAACTLEAPNPVSPGSAGGGNAQALGGAGGASSRPGTAAEATGGTPTRTPDATGGGEPAGAGGDETEPLPTAGCQANQVCATVTVDSDFPSNVKRVAVVLFETKPVITGDGSPWPFASYEPLSDVALSESQPLLLQQDFTKPSWGGQPSGDRFVAVVAFFSDEVRQGVPGVDYWFVSAKPLALEPGARLDLGKIALKLMPVADDLDTAGNDAAGVVHCFGELHDDASPDAYACDVKAKTCCIAQDGGKCGSASCASDGSEVEYDCDGPEDCSDGQVCCGQPLAAHRCVAADSCKTRQACHTDGECNSASAVCVIATTGIADVAYCVGPNPLTPGDDRPGMVQCLPSTTTCSNGCCFEKATATAKCGATCVGTSAMVDYWNCDGPEDCTQGQRCCQSASGGRSCGTTCSAVVCCHVDADCPQGKCATNGQCAL